MKKKFLVIQTAFTGDAILSTSVLESLRKHFPDSTIDLLVRKGNDGLFHQHPFIHQLLVWNKQAGKLRDLLRLLRAIRKSKYDHVINLQRYFNSGLLTAFSGAKETVGFDKNPLSFLFTRKVKHIIGDGRHEIARNHELILHLTGGDAAMPRLYPSSTDRERISEFTNTSFCCIAPGSVWFTKTWPEEKWKELIHLHHRANPGMSYLLLGSPAEKELCERILAGCSRLPVMNLAGKLNLLQSAALMQGAAMNFVNDSAPLHLAGAMNAPVTAIYCSTIPAFGFGPLSRHSIVVETNEALDCRPCGIHGHRSCPKGHFKCAYSIEPANLVS